MGLSWALVTCTLGILVMWALPYLESSAIQKDEEVEFLPTYGAQSSPGGPFKVKIKGWIFEHEQDEFYYDLFLAALAKQLDLSEDRVDEFGQRAHLFLRDYERNKNLSLVLGHGAGRKEGEVVQVAKRTAWHGGFDATVEVQREKELNSVEWMSYSVLLPEGDNREFKGSAQLVPYEGISVVSDIDDTIKITEILNKREMMANTFARKFRAVPGMAALYQKWKEASSQPMAFHYVSGSPVELLSLLKPFTISEGFPRGSFALKTQPHHFVDVPVPGKILKEMFRWPAGYKVTEISKIVDAFPGHSFVLVGDSGEQDPEVYGEIYNKYPGRVMCIYIRYVTGSKDTTERWENAFKGVPPERWTLFKDPGQELMLTDPNSMIKGKCGQ